MILTGNYTSYEEAEKAVTSYLLKGMKGETTLHAERERGENGEILYCLITNTENGRTGFFAQTSVGKYEGVVLPPNQWGYNTYPFRKITPRMAALPMMLHAVWLKPLEALPIDEAITHKGERILDEYFGLVGMDEDGTKTETALRDFFFEDEGKLLCNHLPTSYAISAATGIGISCYSDYAKALEALTGEKLTKRQSEALLSSYTYDKAMYFLMYAVYELARTESYAHLKEVLSSYSRFGLPEDWERIPYLPLLCMDTRHDRERKEGRKANEDYQHLKDLLLSCYELSELPKDMDERLQSATKERDSRRGTSVTAEEYVMAKYLSTDASDILGGCSYTEIAEVLGAPLGLVVKSSRFSVWDF